MLIKTTCIIFIWWCRSISSQYRPQIYRPQELYFGLLVLLLRNNCFVVGNTEWVRHITDIVVFAFFYRFSHVKNPAITFQLFILSFRLCFKFFIGLHVLCSDWFLTWSILRFKKKWSSTIPTSVTFFSKSCFKRNTNLSFGCSNSFKKTH